MSFITQEQWSKFNQIQRQYYEDIAGISVIWRTVIKNVDRWAEGESEETVDIPVKAIVSFNDFRTWPTNRPTESGTLDKENLYLLLNKLYLGENSWLNNNGYFNFDPVMDRFIVDGILYKPDGDTQVSQIYDTVGYIMVILSREPTQTGFSSR